MQLGCYVLMKFAAVERYIDFLLMGFLYLERRRLQDLKATKMLPERGDPKAHWRTTDQLRSLESAVHRVNVDYIRERLKTKRGQAELLARLSKSPCQVA
jgi:hypothetical protein